MTYLHHHHLMQLARVLWFAFAGFGLVIFVAGTAGLYTGLREPCSMLPVVAQPVCETRHASLARLGISMDSYAVWLTLGVILQVLPWLLVGAVIFWRKSDRLFEILVSLALILLGAVVLDPALPIWFVNSYPGLAPLVALTEFVGVALIAIWYVFPDGKFVPSWTRWLALAFVLRAAVVIGMPNAWWNPDNLSAPLPNIILIGFILSMLFSLAYRYARASNLAQRQQIKWIVAAACVYGSIYLVGFLEIFPRDPVVTPLQLSYLVLYYLSACLFAVCIGISILRFRLFEIDVIIRRTVTYTIVVALLLIVYFGSVIALQRIFAGIINPENSEISTVISTLVIAILFIPLRNKIRDAIDQRFNRKKYDAQLVLQKFSETVRDETDLETLSAELVNVVNETMQPKSVSVWLKQDGRER